MTYIIQFGLEFESRRIGLDIFELLPDKDDSTVVTDQYRRIVSETSSSTTVICAHVPFSDKESGWKLWHVITHSDVFERTIIGSIIFHKCSHGQSNNDMIMSKYINE